MILSKQILYNLTNEELISLCFYFDIKWHFYYYYNSIKYKCVSPKEYLIDNLTYYFATNKIQKEIIFSFVSFKYEKLYFDSLVLFGQFDIKNKYCRDIMKQLNMITIKSLSFNDKILFIVYKYWKNNIPLTYIQLYKLYTLRTRQFKYIPNRLFAIRQFNKFVNLL